MEHLLSLAADNWQRAAMWIVGLLAFVPGLIWAWYSWKTRNFMGRVNSSVNFRDNKGVFAFATIDEADLASLFNLFSRLMLARLARQAPAFLRFSGKEEAWNYLNVILNHLSSKFGEGALAYAAGHAKKVEFIFGLTCERHKDLKTRKFRVMLATPELLAEIHAGLEPTYADPRHNGIRGETLKEMAAMWHDPAQAHNLQRINLYLKND